MRLSGIATALAILFASCGQEKGGTRVVCEPVTPGAHDFVTEPFSFYGISVDPQGNQVSEAAMETAVDVTIAMMVERFPTIYTYELALASLQGYSVVFTSTKIPCDTNPSGCVGLITYSTKTITLYYNICVGYTSFSHEMLHLLLRDFEGDSDHNHTRTDIFYQPGSVEEDAEDETFDLVCKVECKEVEK